MVVPDVWMSYSSYKYVFSHEFAEHYTWGIKNTLISELFNK